MILSAALALALAQEASQPSEAEDIVIVGERVRKIRFTIRRNKAGAVVCRIRRSSGDAEIDALACETAQGCLGPPGESREAYLACLTPRWKAIPATLAARRHPRTDSANHAQH
jgi:hypothetical protein